jgi:predicted nucleic acid-binding Zn ribbon protein
MLVSPELLVDALSPRFVVRVHRRRCVATRERRNVKRRLEQAMTADRQTERCAAELDTVVAEKVGVAWKGSACNVLDHPRIAKINKRLAHRLD